VAENLKIRIRLTNLSRSSIRLVYKNRPTGISGLKIKLFPNDQKNSSLAHKTAAKQLIELLTNKPDYGTILISYFNKPVAD